jgi:opacity protein-like surface antigen
MANKKIIYTLLALPVMAQAYGSFYVGVSGGVDTALAKLKVTSSTTANFRNTDYMLIGADWNGRVGYILPFHNNLFFDFNSIGGFSNAMAQQKGNTEFLYKKKYNWSLNAGLGYQRNRMSYEALIGFAEGRFKREGNEAVDPGHNFYHWTPGLQAGLELGAKLSQNLQLTATYLYDYFSGIKSSGIKTSGASENAKNRFIEQRYLLGLNYFFSPLHFGKDVSSNTYDPLGFYVGAAAGYDFTRINDQIVGTSDTERGLSGVIGGPYVGYSFYSSYVHHLNLAVEGFFNWTNSELHEERVNSSANDFYEKVDYVYGLTFNPGVFITKNYLLYGKFGGAYGRFVIGGPLPDTLAYSVKKTKPGYVLGVGVSVGIMNHLRARLEYDYSVFNEVKKTDNTNTLNKFKPRMNDFMLGLSYYI